MAQPATRVILNIVCQSDIEEFHGNMSNPSFEKKVRGQKHPREVNNCKTVLHTLIIFILCKFSQHSAQDNKLSERAGHHRPTLPPPGRHLYTHLLPPSNQTRDDQEETHVHLTIFGIYSLTCYIMGRKVYWHHGSRSAPTAHGLVKATPWLICTAVFMQ